MSQDHLKEERALAVGFKLFVFIDDTKSTVRGHGTSEPVKDGSRDHAAKSLRD